MNTLLRGGVECFGLGGGFGGYLCFIVLIGDYLLHAVAELRHLSLTPWACL